MNIVIFSGGRGNKTLLKAFQQHDPKTSLKVKVIVNGLDDGASTGAIREMFGNNTHGISDFLKVALAMSPNVDLAKILDERVPALESMIDQLTFSKDLYDFLFSGIDLPCLVEYEGKDDIKDDIRKKMIIFIEYFYRKEGSIPNLSDFKLGNIVFAAMLAEKQLNFQASLICFMEFCGVNLDRFQIIQSTESISYLVGVLKNGALLPNEAAVVLTRSNDFISKTFQLPKPLTAAEIRNICSHELSGKTKFLIGREVLPAAGAEALECIDRSDAIIYGAGTPYSSLLPSLELIGMGDRIKLAKGPKILVANLMKETSNTISAVDLIRMTLEFLKKSVIGKNKYNPRDYITHVIIPNDLPNNQKPIDWISMNEDEIRSEYEWINVVRGDIRSSENPAMHDGEHLKECLLSIVNAN